VRHGLDSCRLQIEVAAGRPLALAADTIVAAGTPSNAG